MSEQHTPPTTTRPIRLAIVRARYNPFGGAERFVERALAALGETGIELTLIAREWAQASTAPGVRRLICKPFHLGRVWRDAGFARAVRRLIAREQFDLVQSHERIPGCDIFRAGDGVHATWLALRARSLSPWARLAQACSPWHRYTCAAEDAMFRHPRLRAVICNSDMVRRDIAQRWPALGERLHVLHNGVDLGRFHPGLRAQHRERVRAELGTPDARQVVAYVGSGFARKGVPQLLAAFARPELAHELADAELWIIGKDRAAKALQRRAARLGLSGRVRFLGPQQDVAPYLGAADLFALPTLYDPMPNAAMEALACGLPLLSSTGSGASELIAGRDCGAVVEALDVAAIARETANLLQQLRDPARAAVLRQEARAAVAGLSAEDMAQAAVVLYRRLLSGVAGAPAGQRL